MSTRAEGITDDLRLAWAAGVFDADGTVYRTGNRPPRVVIAMSDEDTIRKFAARMGGRIYGPYVNTNGVKMSWKCHIEGQAAVEDIYAMFRPYIADRRCEQFERVIAGD
jgi:hypothetical protein